MLTNINYTIKRAIACKHRHDLIVNGIVIASESTRKLTQEIANKLVDTSVLEHTKEQKVKLGYTNV